MFSGADTSSNTLSLFSSAGSSPLQLFFSATDKSLPEDSFIALLKDNTSLPAPPAPAKLLAVEDERDGGLLTQTVLHIQSPTISKTYISCGSSRDHLGLNHPWLHLQVRNLHREFSVEVGLVDNLSRMRVLRMSTFQTAPRLKQTSHHPLLHIPLTFPSPSSAPLLTTWTTISLNLPSYLPHFSDPYFLPASYGNSSEDDDALSGHKSLPSLPPTGSYSHVAYVKIYANCRLRRIWFTRSSDNSKQPWEFMLYGLSNVTSET